VVARRAKILKPRRNHSSETLKGRGNGQNLLTLKKKKTKKRKGMTLETPQQDNAPGGQPPQLGKLTLKKRSMKSKGKGKLQGGGMKATSQKQKQGLVGGGADRGECQ